MTSIAPTASSTTVAAPPTLSGLGHVALTVSDLSISVPWYQDVFGEPPALDEDTGPFRHVVFAQTGLLLAAGLVALGGAAAFIGLRKTGKTSTVHEPPPGASPEQRPVQVAVAYRRTPA